MADATANAEFNAQELNRTRATGGIEDLGDSTLNVERQRGRTMEPHELEAMVKRLVPHGLIFKVNPNRPWIAGIYRVVPFVEEPIYLFAYENRTMPEYDVRYAIESWVPDPDYRRVERRDLKGDAPVSMEHAHVLLKKHGLVGAVSELMKRHNNPDRVGYVRVVTEAGTAMRGWRSVLAKLVELRLASVEAVEREAHRYSGLEDRKSWAAHLGKQKLKTNG